MLRIATLLLLLHGCSKDELDLAGEWKNLDGDELTFSGSEKDDRLVGMLSNRWEVLVREHPFGGFSLGFPDGLNIQGGGAEFITKGEISIFCSGCTIDENAMKCKTKPISVEQSGVQLDKAEFDCEWTRPGGSNPGTDGGVVERRAIWVGPNEENVRTCAESIEVDPSTIDIRTDEGGNGVQLCGRYDQGCTRAFLAGACQSFPCDQNSPINVVAQCGENR